MTALAIVGFVIAVAVFGRLSTAVAPYKALQATAVASTAATIATAPRAAAPAQVPHPGRTVLEPAARPKRSSVVQMAPLQVPPLQRVSAQHIALPHIAPLQVARSSMKIAPVATRYAPSPALAANAARVCATTLTDEQRTHCTHARLVDALATYCAQRAMNERTASDARSTRDYSACAGSVAGRLN